MTEEQLKDAAWEYADALHEKLDATESKARRAHTKRAFVAGAEWYRKSLWHDIAECLEDGFEEDCYVLVYDNLYNAKVMVGSEIKRYKEEHRQYICFAYLRDLWEDSGVVW